jgi:hypothetical protein
LLRRTVRARCAIRTILSAIAWKCPVAAFADYAPRCIPLPHPSPRNTAWFQRHPWFAHEVLPMLGERVRAVLGTGVQA